MTLPVPELIALEIVDRLSMIAVDNGYAFDIAEVVRPSRRGDNWKHGHLGVCVQQGEATRVPELDCPGHPPALCYEVLFELKCTVKDSDHNEDPHATNENEMAAEVVRAITVRDGNQWYTMDDNAVDCILGSMTPFESSEGEFNGVSIPLGIRYRVSENNPYAVRA
jgi:hypothetical protein